MGLFDFIFGSFKFARSTVSRDSEDKIKADWVKINVLIKTGGPSNLKQALIMADRSLDTALRDIVSGETMGERLKNVANKYEKYFYNKIWEAHKMRNNLVHEASFEPPYFMINEALEIFKKALSILGVSV